MQLLLPTSSFKTKATVLISGVLSFAAAVSFTIPSVSHFAASCFPIIYDNTVFLLKPPYLYLVINIIILSIFATSKLTHKSSSSTDDSDTVLPLPTYIDTGYLNVPHVLASDYTGENDAMVSDHVHEVIADDKVIEEVQETETEKPIITSNGSPEPETDKPKPEDGSLEIPVLKNTRKPPRFGRQKSFKGSQEGKKSALGVTKPPRRQDTLETTWKKITEGRSPPLAKHFKKADTWQERSKEKILTKSGSLKREASPGQEELNRRVEAFIKKFNEEMRLQRLESLAKYNEMVVNGGTRL